MSLSPVNGSPEGAGRNQLTSATIHGQNHPFHPGPQPLHPGDQEVAATQLEWDLFPVSGEQASFQLLEQTLQTRSGVYRKENRTRAWNGNIKIDTYHPLLFEEGRRTSQAENSEGAFALNKREISLTDQTTTSPQLPPTFYLLLMLRTVAMVATLNWCPFSFFRGIFCSLRIENVAQCCVLDIMHLYIELEHCNKLDVGSTVYWYNISCTIHASTGWYGL